MKIPRLLLIQVMVVEEFNFGNVKINLGSGVYAIVNKFNNKLYCGSSSDITARWRCHLSDLNKNNHHSIHLQRSFNINGIGKFVFMILEQIYLERFDENHPILLEREQVWLDKTQSYLPDFGYNICPIAGSCRGLKMPDSVKFKISESNATKLDVDKVLEIKKMLSEGHRASDIAVKFGVSACHIQQIKFNNCWRQVVFDGEYNFGVAGENNPSAKLNEDDVRQIRSMFGKFKVKEIALAFRVSVPTIESIKYGKTWRSIR